MTPFAFEGRQPATGSMGRRPALQRYGLCRLDGTLASNSGDGPLRLSPTRLYEPIFAFILVRGRDDKPAAYIVKTTCSAPTQPCYQ